MQEAIIIKWLTLKSTIEYIGELPLRSVYKRLSAFPEREIYAETNATH